MQGGAGAWKGHCDHQQHTRETLADDLLELLETQLDPEATHTACCFNAGNSLLLLPEQALPHLSWPLPPAHLLLEPGGLQSMG